jgi:hypothetical protein
MNEFWHRSSCMWNFFGFSRTERNACNIAILSSLIIELSADISNIQLSTFRKKPLNVLHCLYLHIQYTNDTHSKITFPSYPSTKDNNYDNWKGTERHTLKPVHTKIKYVVLLQKRTLNRIAGKYPWSEVYYLLPRIQLKICLRAVTSYNTTEVPCDLNFYIFIFLIDFGFKSVAAIKGTL